MKVGGVIALLLLSAPVALAQEEQNRILGGRSYALQELFYDDFSDGLEAWRAEGDALVRSYGGFMEVNALPSVTDTSVGAATIWCVREFSGPQLVEYDVRLMGDTIFTNVNMFLMASMTDGPGILGTSEQRTGNYPEYHTFPNYLVTTLNANHPDQRRQMTRIRMRRNPGFEMKTECWQEPLQVGTTYHLLYVIEPPEVVVYIDNDLVCRFRYSTPLSSGKHGLRVFHTHSLYSNFRVSRILAK